MSPLAAATLIEAMSRASGEDQATEILAHLLDRDARVREGLCRAIDGALGGQLPPSLGGSASTQRRIDDARRIDCELILRECDGGHHVVWIEVKTDSPETKGQLTGYACELARLWRDQSTMIALAKPDHPILDTARQPLRPGANERRSQTAVPLTWQDLHSCLETIGRAHRGTDGHRLGLTWRQDAQRSDAESQQRVLFEVLRYLERKGLAMPDDPIQVIDALVAKRTDELLDPKAGLISRLLEMAVRQLKERPGDELSSPAGGTPEEWGGDKHYWWSTPLKSPSWPARLDGDAYLDLWFRKTDAPDRNPEAREQPVFLASVELPHLDSSAERPLTQWRPNGWHVWHDKDGIRLSRYRYLSEVAVDGITLSEQAAVLGTWARECFDEILAAPAPTLG